MSAVQFVSTRLRVLECGVCGILHGIPDVKYNAAKEGKGWTCPNGHSLVFTETDVAKVQKELDKEKQRRVWAEESRDIARRDATTQERRARTYKGKFKSIKTRVANGVCPCCNRTFQNLMRHMNTKHPKYKKVGLKS